MLKSVLPYLLLVLIWMTACNLEEKVDEAIVTVSGNVSDDGQPLSGALVMLVESPDSSDGISLANGSITGSSGNYTILNVDPGNYYVMAVDDANDNLKFDVMYDRLGFFGIDPAVNDPEPDAIVVTDDDLVSCHTCNVAMNAVNFLHNQPRRLGYEEIHSDTC